MRVEHRTAVLVFTTALLSFLGAARQAAPSEQSAPAPAARRYRDLTKHSPESVLADSHRLIWKNKPSPYRSYAGAEVIALPPAKRLMQPALEVIAAARPAPAEKAPRLNLEILHAILFLSGGITGKRPSGGDIRATAAAGALYPNEMYVVSGKLPDLAAGIYHYDPKRARLSRLREGDWRGALAQAAADEQIRNADATLALTGIPWRSAWKYRERAYRHLYWDGGMKLAHVLAAAEAVPLPATLVAGFIDDQVDQLLGIDGTTEGSMALVPLGARADPAEPPPSEQPPPLSVRASPLSPHPIDYPEAQRYHRASRLADRAAVHRFRSARMVLPKARRDPSSAVDLPPPAPARSDPSLDAVIRRRRSTRHFARRAISAAELAAALQLSTRGAPADFLTHQPTLLETYVIVNSVQGINAGAYYYNRSRHRLDLLRPENFRREAGFLCLGQELARDASAVLFHMANLNAIFVAFGERGYRLAEMEAGLISGRVYLAAYAVGRGATGLTFFDDEVTRFFSPHAAALEPLLVTAVGVPR